MDPATAAPAGPPIDPVVAEVPPIGVASLPAPTDQERPPAAVPSVAVPEAAVRQPPGLGDAAVGPARSAGRSPTPVRAAPMPVSRPGFPPGVAAKLGSYVYLLVDPRTGRPFFVGRGRGDRCFRHVRGGPGAGAGDRIRPGARYPVLERIREVESGGGRCGSTSSATA